MMRKTSSPAVPTTAETAKLDAVRTAAPERSEHLADETAEAEADRPIDPDDAPMTDERFARLRAAAEIAPRSVVASLRRKGGRPKVEAPKVPISIRLDHDIVEALRAGGSGWQSRANEMLRKGLGLVAR